jgi:hypothetical protein
MKILPSAERLNLASHGGYLLYVCRSKLEYKLRPYDVMQCSFIILYFTPQNDSVLELILLSRKCFTSKTKLLMSKTYQGLRWQALFYREMSNFMDFEEEPDIEVQPIYGSKTRECL